MNSVFPSKLLIAFVLAAVCAVNAVQCANGIAGELANGTEPDGRRACVLLKNNNVLYGKAVQQGEWVVVRRDGGTELKLPGDQVACWGNSLHELYRYRVDHRTSIGPRGRIADIQWCLNHRLFHCASREIDTTRQLLAVRPSPSTERQLNSLQNRLVSLMTVAPEIRTVGHQVAVNTVVKKSESTNQVKQTISPKSLHDFTTSVQPILFNRCGTCHGNSTESVFRLTIPVGGARATRRVTQLNVQAVIPMIDFDNPNHSALLAKAVTPHGNGPAGLGPHDMPAINAIKQWLQEVRVLDLDAADGVDQRVRPEDGSANSNTSSSVQTAGWQAGRSNSEQKDRPARLPAVKNPFDPELFNRRFHSSSTLP